MVARLERKGLGTVAETAPSQVSAGRGGAWQTIDGGRWDRNRGRAILFLAGHMKAGWHQLNPVKDRTSVFSRISAQDGGGDRQPVLLIVIESGENGAPNQFRDLRNYGVSEGCKSVCPIGNPISHSTHVGFSFPPSIAIMEWSNRSRERSRPFLRVRLFGLLPFDIDAVGAGQNFTAVTKESIFPAAMKAFEFGIIVLRGVGHNPDALSAMGSAQGCRWNIFPLCIIPDAGQVAQNSAKPLPWLLSRASKQPCDVLKDDVSRSKLASKSDDLSIQSASCSSTKASALSRAAKVLAWKSAGDDFDPVDSVPKKSICCELSNIIVDWNLWPMFRQYAAWEIFYFAKGNGFAEAGAFKPEREATNTAEQVEKAQLHFGPQRRAAACFLHSPQRSGE